MRKWLKIENPGTSPVEGFTLLGLTSKEASSNPYLIGTFGSGCKFSVAQLLRANLSPVIFCSNHKLEFGTKEGVMKALEGDTSYARMFVKHGGKDQDGRSVTYIEELSQTERYGILDWSDLGMALREFVSNAIDATITFNALNHVETLYPWNGVKIELVDENQVRAKSGYTRVFIPADNEQVISFIANIGKWFLHFSEPELIYRVNTQPNPILLKRNRNFSSIPTAVIYRRGVRVREIGSYYPLSLFDYNLNNLRLDESRNIDDYVCQAYAAKAVSSADVYTLTHLLSSFAGNTVYWEHCFSSYDMRPQYGESEEVTKGRERQWQTALEKLGANAVLITKGNLTDTIIRKGYKPIQVPENFVKIGEILKLRTSTKVLSEDDQIGRQIISANQAAVDAVNWCWDLIRLAGMDNGKKQPVVHCFRSLMDGEGVTNGFCRDDNVYLNENICSGSSVALRQVALEELVHFCTNSLDGSRDLQQFAFELAVRHAMVKAGELPPGTI